MPDEACGRDPMVYGSLLGLAGASALDAFMFAKEPQEPVHATRWYGTPLLVLEAVGLAYGVFLSQQPLPDGSRRSLGQSMAAGVWGFGTVASPIVHFANGHGGRGLGAFALRLVGMPLVAIAGVLSSCVDLRSRGECPAWVESYALTGAVVTTSLFDHFMLAQEEVRSEAVESFQPYVIATPNTVLVGSSW